MPRDIYNDGELVTDDLGRLWLVSALKTGVGLLMPELPDFLSQQEERKSAVEGFEFDQYLPTGSRQSGKAARS